ncbi:MAG: SpoIIE family protein phosphatase [Clostridia bacterium]|nr:SpoIIE family protein phosphatase [Clostridia bacterium]
MTEAYIKIGIAALWPSVASVVLYALDRYTKFGKIKNIYKQIIFGVVFGALAVMGTELGVPINGAQMNVRDAAVLSAGLFFGAPAGIIAGVIGGVERWIAVAWGVGTFTRLACSVSTFIAGVYAALLRKFMFENKKPAVFISLAIGVVMEVFHMTMVFLTNMANPEAAMAAVKKCAYIMIPANGLSVMFVAFLLMLMSREKGRRKNSQTRISQTIQRWLLVTVTLAFFVTSIFVFSFQTKIAEAQADNLLVQAIVDTSADITDASDANLLNITYRVAQELDEGNIDEIAQKYNLAEINLVNKKGMVYKSTVKKYIGFDMSSGRQSREFLCLLGNTKEYAQDYATSFFDSSVMRKYAGIKSEDGFIQVGYDAKAFEEDISEQVVGITRNRHLGQTGYVLILDGQLNVVSAPRTFGKKNLGQAATRMEIPEDDITFSMEINGCECLCRHRMSEGYFILSALPAEEAMQMRNIALYINTFMEILVFAVLFALIYLLIKKVVVNQIKSINRSLGKITGGDLNEIVDVRTSEEFASLSDDINSTVDTLKKYIDDASARIDAELEFAKNIQASALPDVVPSFNRRKDFEIYASMHPAKEVGGDFYDFYITDSDTLNFLIADVSGKGIPAAMFMMRAMTELKSLTESGRGIDDVFTYGSEALCEGNDAGMFVTAWQGGIDLTTGLVRFANAGHNPPLVKHSDGRFEYLKTRAGFVLAGMEGVKYRKQELQLEPGDIIYLYTDGVTEATNSENELYGENRLLSVLNSRSFESMEELCKYVKADVDRFVGSAPQFDDITMVALKYVGIPSVKFEKAQIQDIVTVTEFIESELEKLDCPMKAVMQLNVAVDELFSNIVRYGYPDEPGPVTVKFIEHDDPKTVYIRFEDEGIPYNPLAKEDPDITLAAEERSIGGLGVFVVKKTMDDVKYKYEDGKNILTIKKYI